MIKNEKRKKEKRKQKLFISWSPCRIRLCLTKGLVIYLVIRLNLHLFIFNFIICNFPKYMKTGFTSRTSSYVFSILETGFLIKTGLCCFHAPYFSTIETSFYTTDLYQGVFKDFFCSSVINYMKPFKNFWTYFINN